MFTSLKILTFRACCGISFGVNEPSGDDTGGSFDMKEF